MRRAMLPFFVFLFFIASLPASLAAGEERTFRLEPPPSQSRPPAAAERPARPGRPGHGGWNPKPPYLNRPPHGGPRPQWSISIHNRPDRPHHRPPQPRYETCPPHCGYGVYRYGGEREREAEREAERDQSIYFGRSEEPKPRTYFQSGGPFERHESGAAPPPAAAYDGYQTNVDTYNLMMKAWQ
jgi:hypothetical protein